MEKTYTTGEVAELFQVDRRTVYLWCRDGKIDAFRLSDEGHYRITRSAIIAYAEKHNIPLQLD